MKAEHFEKIIAVNDTSYEVIRNCINKLLFFMYEENANKDVEYFRLRLKDSEKSPFGKDLLLEWVCHKQPERSKREDMEGPSHLPDKVWPDKNAGFP